jgi:hypothetical protein
MKKRVRTDSASVAYQSIGFLQTHRNWVKFGEEQAQFVVIGPQAPAVPLEYSCGSHFGILPFGGLKNNISLHSLIRDVNQIAKRVVTLNLVDLHFMWSASVG